MIRTRIAFIFLSAFLAITHLSTAQVQSSDSIPEEYNEVLGLVNFYKYLLNTVGSAGSSRRDKDVIINESYLKAFEDSKVQVEDDLLDDRKVVTNKDVKAYLRDVDFFFNDITFKFNDLKISKETIGQGQFYYLVSFESEVSGVDLEGVSFTNRNKRFIEINYDQKAADLKIASVYTTKTSREEELRNWWNNLSYDWVRVLKRYVDIQGDSISNIDLLALGNIDTILLSGNQEIYDIRPLEALRELKYLDISETKITDLSPIRSASNLRRLDIAGTNIEDIDVIQYFDQLDSLDISRTGVTNIEALRRIIGLKHLNLSGTSVGSFLALSGLNQLTDLDLSSTSFSQIDILSSLDQLLILNLKRTGITNLEGLGNLRNLKSLDISETYVSSVDDLRVLSSLEIIRLNQTPVRSIDALSGMRSLRRINADYSGLSEAAAGQFMAENNWVVVITNSEKTMAWWKSLSEEWKEILTTKMGVTQDPGETEIIRLLNTDTLDISGLRVLDGSPLARFRRLQYLDVSDNLFVNIEFTSKMSNLTTFKASNIAIGSARVLSANKGLREIVLNNSNIEEIASLNGLNKLELLDLSNTAITNDQVQAFLKVSPDPVVIYRTDELASWWEVLTPNWREVFELSEVTDYNLHELTQRKEIIISDTPITSLIPLRAFLNLQEVNISNTQVADLSDLEVHENITKIVCKNGPLKLLTGIERHRNLQELDISNSAVSDLKSLRESYQLESLDISGTGIKKLNGLEELKKLEALNISNTRVWQLDRLYDIRELKSLTCYNTRIRSSEISEFKGKFPNCKVTFY